MKRQRFIPLLMAVCLLFALTACDDGLTIIGLEVESYPDKLIYIASVDDTLDLSGGSFRFILKDERAGEPVGSMDDERDVTVRHDIDFTKEGTYVVEIYRNDNAKITFPILVVSIETLESMIASQ